MARSRSYREFLLEMLQDYDQAMAYLSAAVDECLIGGEEEKQLFLMALQDVSDAQRLHSETE